jgi:F0F1-type ATP synthase assembly protein I
MARAYRASAPWLDAVWRFTGGALFGVGAGYAFDAWRGTGPWGLVVGGMVGSGVGFYAFITTANRLMAQQKNEQNPK